MAQAGRDGAAFAVLNGQCGSRTMGSTSSARLLSVDGGGDVGLPVVVVIDLGTACRTGRRPWRRQIACRARAATIRRGTPRPWSSTREASSTCASQPSGSELTVIESADRPLPTLSKVLQDLVRAGIDPERDERDLVHQRAEPRAAVARRPWRARRRFSSSRSGRSLRERVSSNNCARVVLDAKHLAAIERLAADQRVLARLET